MPVWVSQTDAAVVRGVLGCLCCLLHHVRVDRRDTPMVIVWDPHLTAVRSGSPCGVVWCSLVWFGVVWCGVVWCGVVWCGVVWCGVVWCGVVWCSVVWWGVVWWGGLGWSGVQGTRVV